MFRFWSKARREFCPITDQFVPREFLGEGLLLHKATFLKEGNDCEREEDAFVLTENDSRVPCLSCPIQQKIWVIRISIGTAVRRPGGREISTDSGGGTNEENLVFRKAYHEHLPR